MFHMTLLAPGLSEKAPKMASLNENILTATFSTMVMARRSSALLQLPLIGWLFCCA
jgi:hypothetical protein